MSIRNSRLYRAGATAVLAGALSAAALGAANPASADAVSARPAVITPHALSCSWGYNNANTAWFTCSGSGIWMGWVNCYYYPGQQTSWITQNGGTVHEWLTCPSPSHVTGGGFH
jgi:hypothetical protein